MQHLGRVLIVEPDAKAAEVLVRECARLRRTHLTATAAAAREQLASRPSITALIVEHSLPDARGITLLDEFRGAYPYTPSLMLTAAFDAALLNRCHLLRAEFVAKPAHRHNVRAFLRRSVAFERVPDRRVAQLVDELVLAVRLSPRETDVLAAAMQGVPRKIIADQIGTTDNTIKSCVKSILRKCDASSLGEVSRDLWMKALAGSDLTRDDDDRRALGFDSATFTIPPPGPR